MTSFIQKIGPLFCFLKFFMNVFIIFVFNEFLPTVFIIEYMNFSTGSFILDEYFLCRSKSLDIKTRQTIIKVEYFKASKKFCFNGISG